MNERESSKSWRRGGGGKGGRVCCSTMVKKGFWKPEAEVYLLDIQKREWQRPARPQNVRDKQGLQTIDMVVKVGMQKEGHRDTRDKKDGKQKLAVDGKWQRRRARERMRKRCCGEFEGEVDNGFLFFLYSCFSPPGRLFGSCLVPRGPAHRRLTT